MLNRNITHRDRLLPDNARMSASAQTVHNFPRAEPRKDSIQPPQVSLPQRIKSLFTWESLRVAGREVKGFVVPGWAAGVILATIIGAFGFMYSQNQAQREMLIRLDERLIERNDRDRERQEALEKWKQNADAIQVVLRRDLARIEATLQMQKGNGNNH